MPSSTSDARGYGSPRAGTTVRSPRRLALRLQHQLLHPPVQQLRGVDGVFRRAGQRVDPAELFQLLAGAAEHAQHLAVEAELVDAAGPGIRTVEHLMRRRRDADRPGRAGMEGAARHHRLVGNLADRGLGVGWDRHVDSELAQEFSVAVEYLN